MPIKRQTAIKVRIADLIAGEWVKKEGMEPSFVRTAGGSEVSRARVMATVVGQFISHCEKKGLCRRSSHNNPSC